MAIKHKPKSSSKSRQAKKISIAKNKTKKVKAVSRARVKAIPKIAKKTLIPKTTIRKTKKAKNAIRKTPKSIRKTKRAKLTKPQRLKQRNFKKGVSLLKKLGVAFRRSKPSSVKSSKKNQNLLSRFADVISGKAKAYKVSNSKARAYRKAGYVVKDGFLILPKKEGVKIRTTKGGFIEKSSFKGGSIERLILPIEYKNLRQFLKAAEKDATLNAMTKKGGRLAFRFFGNNSLNTFENLELMMEYLGYYESVQEAIASGKASEMLEVYKNIEIVSVKSTSKWEADKHEREESQEWKRNIEFKRPAKDRLRYSRMQVRNPGRFAYQAARRTINANKWYERNKNNPAFLAKRAEQRKRARARKKGAK